MGFWRFHQTVLAAVCLLLIASTSVDSGTHAQRLQFSTWETRLHVQPASTVANGLLEELTTFDSASIGELDEFWARVDLLTFVMGQLLEEAELASFMDTLERGEAGETGQFVLAVFWANYADSRIPRRLLARSTNASSLNDFDASPDGLVRTGSLVARIRKASDSNNFPEAGALINNLADLAPDQNATMDSIRYALKRFEDLHWYEHGKIASLRDVTNDLECSDRAASLIADLPECARALANIEPKHLSDALLEGLRDAPDLDSLQWCAALLASHFPDTLLQTDAMDSAVASALLESNFASTDPVAVYELLAPTGTLENLNGKDASKLNALGMALVRAGAEESAIAVFDTLAASYPESQLAATATEHVQHLRAFRPANAPTDERGHP